MAQITSTQTPGDVCRTSYYNSTADCWRQTSCRECLGLPGCLVNQNGVCSTVWSSPERFEMNYTRAIAMGFALPNAKDDPRSTATQEWVFEAGQVSYCPDNDAVCTKCLAERFWSPEGDVPYYWRDSRFCVGANGCVCVSNCEDVDHTCDEHLRYTENYNASKYPTPLPSASASPPTQTPPSSSGSSGKDVQPPTGDECRFTATDAADCHTFRPCHDCVTKKGCRVSEHGFCERDPVNATTGQGYQPGLDFHLASQNNLTLPDAHDRNASDPAVRQYYVFPAFEVRYCPVSDFICQRCMQEQFWVKDGDTADSRYCVGADGCVCIANCARADDDSTCPWRATEQVKVPPSSPSTSRSWTLGAVSVGMGVVVALVACLIYKRRPNAAPRQGTGAPTTAFTGPAPSAPLASPGVGVTDEYSFYSDGTSPSVRPVPSAPPTPGAHDAQASAPALDLQPMRAQPPPPVSAVRQRTTEPPRPALELYGWISHRQHLIDAETRWLHGADDVVPPRHRL